jgi:hypothetical protein
MVAAVPAGNLATSLVGVAALRAVKAAAVVSTMTGVTRDEGVRQRVSRLTMAIRGVCSLQDKKNSCTPFH